MHVIITAMNTLTGAPVDERPYKVRRVDGSNVLDLEADVVSLPEGILQLTESSAPPPPPTNNIRMYANTDQIRVVDSSGNDQPLAKVSLSQNPIPTMTSNTTPAPYIVQHSSSLSQDAGYRLFDRDPNTNWHSELDTYESGVPIADPGNDFKIDNASTPGQWVTCQLPGAVAIKSYTMTPRTDVAPVLGNGQPLHWYIVYSNDGVLWHAAHRVTLASKLLQPTTFELPISTIARHVGIVIDRTADGRNYTAFGDLEFEQTIPGHTHTSDELTDFTQAVNTLIASNTDPMAHTHTAQDITDFDVVRNYAYMGATSGYSVTPNLAANQHYYFKIDHVIGIDSTVSRQRYSPLNSTIKTDIDGLSDEVIRNESAETHLYQVQVNCEAEIEVNNVPLDGLCHVILERNTTVPEVEKIQSRFYHNGVVNASLSGVVELAPDDELKLGVSCVSGTMTYIRINKVYMTATQL